MTRTQHILVVTALLGLSCLVQTVVVCRATTTALDSIRFVRIAQQIEREGLLPTIRTEREQPLFPVWICGVHKGLQLIGDEFPSIWAASAQLAAATALVLAVVPLYLALMRLVGSAAATAGSLFFCLLPEVSRLGADGISDSTHLLLFCLAFWAVVEYLEGRGGRKEGKGKKGEGGKGERRKRGEGERGEMKEMEAPATWLLLAGAAMAMAVLTRVEALVLGMALGVALVAFQFLSGYRRAWRSFAAATGCFVLGVAVVMGPYLVVMGDSSFGSAVNRVLGRYEPACQPTASDEATVWRMSGGEPMSFDVKQRGTSSRRRGYAAAVTQFGEELTDAFGYWIGALALFGVWRMRSRPAGRAERFVQIFFVLFSLMVIWHTAAEGYLAPRHLLVLVAVGMGSAAYGALQLGRCMANRTRLGRKTRRVGACNHVEATAIPRACKHAPYAWLPVVLAGVACLPPTLVRHHDSRAGHRAAGRWLAEQHDAPGAVLDTRGLSGLYSGRRTYLYENSPVALNDPQLAYVVVEKQELGHRSRRSRTLRWLIESASGATIEFPDAATRRPKQQPVIVCRWYPHRFSQRLAAGLVNSLTKEDRHAGANASVRR